MVENRVLTRSPVGENSKLLALLFVNLSLALIWHLFLPAWGALDYVIGFVVGALALSVYERAYGWRLYWLVSFLLLVGKEIIVSNIALAWLLLQPHPRLAPGIVAIPLDVTSDLEVTILATIITLTPGTLSLELGQNDHGQRVLYVHNLVVDDPAAMRQSIKETFERKLLRVTQGMVA
jgi:multicomponent Na+:H+ antiporter subunit E